jgi:23S rRNA pseudouridine2605 synthase
MGGPEPVRIQKILASRGVASRRTAEKLMREGRVRVNGEVVTEPGAKAVPGTDVITVDQRELSAPEPLVYYMFNKPEGFLTALSDGRLGRPTISVFLDTIPQRVYPVGRLDRDVTGFLVLTNDGELARRLMHPSFRVPKTYRALVTGSPSPRALRLLRSGELIIGGKRAEKAQARIIGSGPDEGLLELTVTEGRRHQVKLMCAQAGCPVQKLKRTAYSGIELDPALSPGSIRALTQKEVAGLKKAAGLNPET